MCFWCGGVPLPDRYCIRCSASSDPGQHFATNRASGLISVYGGVRRACNGRVSANSWGWWRSLVTARWSRLSRRSSRWFADHRPVFAGRPGLTGASNPPVMRARCVVVDKKDRGHHDARGLGRVAVISGARSRRSRLESARLLTGSSAQLGYPVLGVQFSCACAGRCMAGNGLFRVWRCFGSRSRG